MNDERNNLPVKVSFKVVIAKLAVTRFCSGYDHLLQDTICHNLKYL